METDTTGKLSQVTKNNLSDLAYQQLRRALMRSELPPGERLRLRPLSKHLGISATPIREALIRLVSENALKLDARGTAVVPLLKLAELREIQSLRIMLEGEAGTQAAQRITSAELEALRAIQHEIADCHATEDFDRALLLNEKFHFGVITASGMPINYQILETLWMRCGPILSHLYDTGNFSWAVHPHDVVLEGLEKHDGAMVREAIRRDIIEGGQSLIDYLSAQENPPMARRASR